MALDRRVLGEDGAADGEDGLPRELRRDDDGAEHGARLLGDGLDALPRLRLSLECTFVSSIPV